MVEMIVNEQAKLNRYWACLRTASLISVAVVLLSGCSMDVGSASFTLKRFDDKNFQPLMQTIIAVAWLTGLFLIVSGFFKLKVYGQMKTMMSTQSTILPPLMYLSVGTGLLYLPFLAENSLYSIWGSSDVLAYLGNGDGRDVAVWTNYVVPVTHVMRIIGYVSFVRGWLALSRLGKEGGGHQGTASKGFMHILGGLLAINFLGTVSIIWNSFT